MTKLCAHQKKLVHVQVPGGEIGLILPIWGGFPVYIQYPRPVVDSSPNVTAEVIFCVEIWILPIKAF